MSMMMKNKLRAAFFPFLFYPFYALVKGLTLYFRMKGASVRDNEGKKRILFLASFFPGNAGYYWRVEKWAEILRNEGYDVEIRHVFDRNTFYRLRARSSVIRFQFLSMYRRLVHVLYSRHFDRVIVRRTLLIYNEYGNLFYEKLLLSIHPRAILDFDDDMLIREDPPRKMTRYGKCLLENHHKFYDSLRIYQRFIAGSHYLAALVNREHPGLNPEDVLVIPTCVDYGASGLKEYGDERSMVRLGWIGGSGNLFYLDKLVPALNRLYAVHPFELLVISGKEYRPAGADFPVKNLSWSLADEQEQLRQIDIGLMPLNDDELSKGKCGFKLVQYAALGIVAVASGLPANREIIEDGVTGFIADNDEQWLGQLMKAVENRSRWPGMGKAARKKMETAYMFKNNTPKYISFLER